MKKHSILFILGAGASKPYGFPSGLELYNKAIGINIAESISTTWEELKIRELDILQFQEDLRLSGLSSVDAFLENNPRYMSVGKAIIAYLLIMQENYTNLYSPSNDDNWYRYLIENMLRNRPFRLIEANQVSFITYNYDRSLEFYLFNSLKRSNERITNEECLQKIRAFRIVHLHGSLGAPRYYENLKGRLYSDEIHKEQIQNAADNILIISENVEKYTAFETAYDLIGDADNIVFMGFGYHPMNIRRLKLVENKKQNAVFWGTSHGWTEAEKKTLIMEQFNECGGINLQSVRNLQFLKDHVELLVQ